MARRRELAAWRVLPNKQRTLSIERSLVDSLTTAIEGGEILTEIELPVEQEGVGVSYKTLVDPASGFAVAGAAARVRIEDGKLILARVGITGVGAKPYRAAAVERALAAAAAEGVEALSDLHASAEYRAHLAGVLARRALEEALERAT